MEAVILAGKQVAMETQWPPDTPERAAMDSLRAQYGALEERWKVLSREAEEWGQLVEKVLPEMEKFQVRGWVCYMACRHTHTLSHHHTFTHTGGYAIWHVDVVYTHTYTHTHTHTITPSHTGPLQWVWPEAIRSRDESCQV